MCDVSLNTTGEFILVCNYQPFYTILTNKKKKILHDINVWFSWGIKSIKSSLVWRKGVACAIKSGERVLCCVEVIVNGVSLNAIETREFVYMSIVDHRELCFR